MGTEGLGPHTAVMQSSIPDPSLPQKPLLLSQMWTPLSCPPTATAATQTSSAQLCVWEAPSDPPLGVNVTTSWPQDKEQSSPPHKHPSSGGRSGLGHFCSQITFFCPLPARVVKLTLPGTAPDPGPGDTVSPGLLHRCPPFLQSKHHLLWEVSVCLLLGAVSATKEGQRHFPAGSLAQCPTCPSEGQVCDREGDGGANGPGMPRLSLSLSLSLLHCLEACVCGCVWMSVRGWVCICVHRSGKVP